MTRYWHLVGLVLLLSFLMAETPQCQAPQLIKYSRKDGLPSNDWNFHLLQDSRGYLWGCSSGGLFRYDGHEFKDYRREDGLDDSFVLRSFEDALGRVWILSQAGFLMRADADSLVPYAYNDVLKLFASRDRVWFFLVDEAENVYLGHSQLGLIKIDTEGDIHYLVKLREGRAGVGICFFNDMPPLVFGLRDTVDPSSEPALHVFNGNFEETARSPLVPWDQSVPHRAFYTRCRDGSVVMTYGMDIYRIDQQGAKEHLRQEGLLNAIMEDAKGNLWASTVGRGMVIYPGGRLDESTARSFHDRYIFHWAVQDRQGGLWLGSHAYGVFYMPEPLVLHFDTVNSTLTENIIRDIDASKDAIYLATTYRRIMEFKDDRVTRMFDWREHLATTRSVGGILRDIYWDSRSQRLFMAFQNRIHYQNSAGDFFTIPVPDTMSNAGFCVRFQPSTDSNTVWAVFSSALMKIRGDSIVAAFSMPGNDYVSAIWEDEDGTLWLAGNRGLWSRADGKFTKWEGVFEERASHVSVFKGRVFVNLYERGLIMKHGDSVLNISKAFRANSIYGFHQEKDTLWAIGNNHLYKLFFDESDTLRLKRMRVNYDIESPLYTLLVRKNAMYFACTGGLLKVDRSDLDFESVPPLVHITSVCINDRDTLSLPSYELDYDQDYIRIGYVGIAMGSKIEYSYRMSGVDREWQSSREQSVQYTKLPPGRYRFEVYAMNQEGVVSGTTAATFVIAPPYWATWWFRSMVAALLIIAVVGFVRSRWRRIENRRKTEQQLLRLESQALRAQMNPHFIFNVLGAIQGYVSERDTEASEAYLGKFARLIRLILENSRHSFISLSQEIETVRYYLEMEKMRFQNSFEYSFQIDPEIDLDTVHVPPMLIQPYLENAILHGIAPLAGGGFITLRMMLELESIHCIIEDNGVGRGSEQREKLGDMPDHKSLGMLITRERLQLLYNENAELITVSTEDLKNETGAPSGTRVSLRMPITLP